MGPRDPVGPSRGVPPEDTQQRRREAELVARIARLLTERLDIEGVGRSIADLLPPLFGVQSSSLRLLAPDRSVVVIAWGGQSHLHFDPVHVTPPGQGMVGRAVAAGRPMQTPDLLAEQGLLLDEAIRDRVRDSNDRAFLAVPLRVKGTVIGVLTLADPPGRVFTEAEVALAQTFADQAALALDNARHLAEARRRQQEAEALARVARVLTESLSVAAVGQRVVDSVISLFRVRGAGLRLLRADGALVAVATQGPGITAFFPAGHVLAPGEALSGLAVARGHAVTTSDILADEAVRLSEDGRRRITESGQRAYLSAPLRAKGRIIGILILGDDRGRVFSTEEIALAEAFADQAALALENARLFEEAETRASRLGALTRLNALISSSLDMPAVLSEIARASAELMSAPFASFWLADEAAQSLEVGAVFADQTIRVPWPVQRVPFGEGAVGWVATHRSLVNAPDALEDPRVLNREWFRSNELSSLLAVPVLLDGGLLAVLVLCAPQPFLPGPESVDVLQSLVAQAGLAIRNARLYDEISRHRRVLEALTLQLVTVQEAERKRLSREIHDEVGQSLSAIKMSLGLILEDLQGFDEGVQARVTTAMNAIGDTLREVRRISSDLRPVSLDSLGLDAALQSHVHRFVALTGLAVDFSIEGRSRPLDSEISTLLYRVAQEALTNVARHGAATGVGARLRYRESLVELTVTDDGRGFDVEAVMESGWKDGHFGLIGIQERVRQLGGTFLLSSSPGGGTQLTVGIRHARAPGIDAVPPVAEQ